MMVVNSNEGTQVYMTLYIIVRTYLYVLCMTCKKHNYNIMYVHCVEYIMCTTLYNTFIT